MKEKAISLYFIVILLYSIFYTSEPVSLMVLATTMIILLFYIVYIAIIMCKYNKESINIRQLFNKDRTTIRLIINKYKTESIILLFLAFYCASTVINLNFDFRQIYSIFIIVIGIYLIGSKVIKHDGYNTIIRLIKTYVFISAFVGALGVILFYNNIPIYIAGKQYGVMWDFFGKTAMISIMRHPNSLGMFSALAIIFTLMWIKLEGKNRKINMLLILNIVLQLHNLLKCASRNSILILLITIIVYFIAFYNGNYKRYIIAGTIAGVALSVLIIFIFKGNESILFTKLTQGDFTSGRLQLWSGALQAVKENMLWGLGSKNVFQWIGMMINDPNNILGTHNGYLDVLLSTGIFSFILYYGFIFIIIIKSILYSIKARKITYTREIMMRNMLLCILISMLIGNMAETLIYGEIYFTTVVFWITLVSVNYLSSFINNMVKGIGE